jgi:transcriptional regulator with XRE-family HTH domain
MIKPKQERLREVYEHLRQHFGVHTQIDFAKALGLTRPAISSAMNGNEAYLTDNLFKRICAAYQGVFNLDYLLTGNGQLLTIQEEVKSEQIEKESNPQQPTSYANKLIASLEKQVKDKDDQLADKDRIIHLLEQKIEVLEAMQHIDSTNPLKGYPFHIGAAEGENYSNVSPNKI